MFVNIVFVMHDFETEKHCGTCIIRKNNMGKNWREFYQEMFSFNKNVLKMWKFYSK